MVADASKVTDVQQRKNIMGITIPRMQIIFVIASVILSNIVCLSSCRNKSTLFNKNQEFLYITA